MDGREWGMLVALSVLWGGSFFFVGVAVHDLPTLTLIWLRVAIAAAALVAVMRLRGERLGWDGRHWRAFFGMGLLNNAAPFALIAWGQHRIASGLAAILIATTPLWAVLVAHALTQDERLTALKAAGVLTGFAGAAVMVGRGALHGADRETLAAMACLAAALAYAFGGVFGRRFRRLGVPPLAAAAGQVSAASVILLPVMLAVDRPWTLAPPHLATWGAVLGLALLATALAYVLYFRILATAGATNLLLVTFLIPLSAILLGVLVLQETLLVRHAVGMALIGGGLAFIDGRLPRALLSRTAS